MWGNKDVQQNPPSAHQAPGSGNPRDPNSQAGSNTRLTAWLGPTVSVKGQISGNEDLRIEGRVEGPIALGGHRLTVGRTAEVTSDVVVREMVVQGKVNGNIRARDRIEIRKDGAVLGDLTTCRLVVEDGARLKGNIEIDRSNTQVGTDLDSLLARAPKKE